MMFEFKFSLVQNMLDHSLLWISFLLPARCKSLEIWCSFKSPSTVHRWHISCFVSQIWTGTRPQPPECTLWPACHQPETTQPVSLRRGRWLSSLASQTKVWTRDQRAEIFIFLKNKFQGFMLSSWGNNIFSRMIDILLSGTVPVHARSWVPFPVQKIKINIFEEVIRKVISKA